MVGVAFAACCRFPNKAEFRPLRLQQDGDHDKTLPTSGPSRGGSGRLLREPQALGLLYWLGLSLGW